MKLSRPTMPKWPREIGWRTVVGAVLLGGVIHIVATFAIPALGPAAAMRKLREALPLNQMVILPPAAPGRQPLPFMAPDAFHAVCRYDVTTNPVNVSAVLGDPGWTLSLHTPQGDNFYVMPAQQLRRNEVSFMVAPGGDRAADFGLAARRPSGSETFIETPTTEGLIVLRAPLRGLSWQAVTEAMLRRASCTPVAAKR